MKKILTILFTLFLVPQAWSSDDLSSRLNVNSRISDVHAVLQKFPEDTKKYLPGTIDYSTVEDLINQFTAMEKKKLGQSQWLEKIPVQLTQGQYSGSFTPFVQKKAFAPGTQVAFWGDLHGSVHSLVRCLNTLKERGYMDDEFRILNPYFNMVFLGDFVDRGMYGIEVIYILMRLKLANPDNVYCVRGNHEDRNLNVRFGFQEELTVKFPKLKPKQIDAIYHIYDMFPVAFYCGVSFGLETHCVQCCHGGLEIGYNAHNFLKSPQEFHWINKVQRKENVAHLPIRLKQRINKSFPKKELLNFVPIAPTSPSTLGFMWSDFEIDNSTEKVARYNAGRGWVYGQLLTEHLLKQASSKFVKLRGVFRAHQHNGMMLNHLKKNNGIIALWDHIVFTFLSAPAANLDFNHDSFGIVTLNGPYNYWALEHVVKEVR
ncbi:MAG TPA: metallophosphoesterase family protein [Candidatus Babeliales bacterium]|nr:metallophosphoesterase family protein [Candidatus Babeliales bacterium]